jgi:N utilization substance protein B
VAPAALLRDLPIDPEAFVADLVAGVDRNQERIDSLIARFAIGWALDRMPVIDRCLLRLSTYELLERSDVPVGAIISEAVELANRFSTEESGRFVNGVLAAIASEVRPLEAAPPPP